MQLHEALLDSFQNALSPLSQPLVLFRPFLALFLPHPFAAYAWVDMARTTVILLLPALRIRNQARGWHAAFWVSGQ